ncbi:glycoside hydrolase family 172 protein [Pseudonocardia hispaniensis]|uniref:Glycoside hydrolase family 172 protein n=1 Tax=Pseudonocardia hispaniensis TaxID=904933 RepID=A0ABW1J199_9PSEU
MTGQPVHGLAALTCLDQLALLRPHTLACGQSSYERDTRGPGRGNDDWNHFLGVRGPAGRREKVMLDRRGPGVVYRIWVTGFDPATDWLRVYFDDEPAPRIDLLMAELFSGTTAPFLAPLVADDTVSSGGYTCYLPLPYRHAITITTTMSRYYNIGVHTFGPDTPVATWTGTEDTAAARRRWAGAGTDPGMSPDEVVHAGTVRLRPGSACPIFEADGPRSISAITLTVPGVTAAAPREGTAEILNGLRIRMYWDEDAAPSVDAPLGCFFGMGRFGAYPTRALVVGLDAADRLYTRLPMPFRRHARVELTGSAAVAGPGGVGFEVRHRPLAGDLADVGYLRTRLTATTPTAAGCDIPILDVTGSGNFVGVTASYLGRPDRWFLEGDERIYVDDSGSPAFHGTGTEDFFNGGWYFARGPYTQPMSGNTAHLLDERAARIAAYRFFLQDAVPFRRRIRVSIEHGGFNDTTTDAWMLAYYYHQPRSRLTMTDTLDIGDPASESAHAYRITEQRWAGARRYQYEGVADTVDVLDTGRAHRGTSRFVLRIAPDNDGVLLRRRFDQTIADQRADVLVDDRPVGSWYVAGGNPFRQWRDADFLIPPSVTAGRTMIEVTIRFVASALDWNEFTYWAYSLTPPERAHSTRDTVGSKPPE